MTKDIIVGIHSIIEAINNPERLEATLLATEKSFKELKDSGKLNNERLKSVTIKLLDAHQLQQEAQKIYAENDLKFTRIPSQIFLQVSALPVHDTHWLYQLLDKKIKEGNRSIKLFCLDQVTDVYNGAAIMRTAAFYDVDALILTVKGSLGLSPSFFRIASGATEYVKIVRCINLSKLITKLEEKGIECIGFDEHEKSENTEENQKLQSGSHRCLVMGSEDRGLSYAVKRNLKKLVALKAQGKIQTLNVSVASGIVMEKYF